MGVLSWTLLIGAMNGVALALLIAFGPGRRSPRILLASLIALVALRLVPFILGYAGVYDAHPWLTFAPFDFSLSYGPLLWAYVASLTRREYPTGWAWHLAPAGFQVAYWIVCFCLPLEAKWDWYTGPHLNVIAPVGAALSIGSAVSYLWLSWRKASEYGSWLDASHANHDDARLVWLRSMLVAFGLAVATSAAFALTSWLIVPLDYFDRFPLMIAFAGLTYALGLLGWKHGGVDYPRPALQTDRSPETPATTRDYQAQAQAWRSALKASELWRDEALDLAGLARHLRTSPRTLSRTLSEGLGQTFREFLGRLRVEAASEALAAPDSPGDVLRVAFDVGFNSKASFNRAFRRYVGMTPTAWRAHARRRKNRQSTPAAESEAIANTG